MKPLKLPAILSGEKGLWVISVLFILLGVAAMDWNSNLNKAIQTQMREYQKDQALFEGRADYERMYQEIISVGGGRPGSRLETNEWIRETQSLARENGLDLREVTPVKEEDVDVQDGGAKLAVTLEGEIKDWVTFLHRLAESSGPVYAAEFKVLPAGTEKSRLRIEMVLAQI